MTIKGENYEIKEVKVHFCSIKRAVYARIGSKNFELDIELSKDVNRAREQWNKILEDYDQDLWNFVILFHAPDALSREFDRRLEVKEGTYIKRYLASITISDGWPENTKVNEVTLVPGVEYTDKEISALYKHGMNIEGIVEHYKLFTTKELAEFHCEKMLGYRLLD
jgi:hypothetical protein